MKKLIIALFVTVLLLGSSFVTAQDTKTVDLGGEFGLTWKANPESDLAGYRIYLSSTSGSYVYGADKAYAQVGIMTEPESVGHSISGAGTYYFVVTAFDLGGHESLPSNEVSLIVEDLSPKAPTGCVLLKF